jgi:hypothetical protein
MSPRFAPLSQTYRAKWVAPVLPHIGQDWNAAYQQLAARDDHLAGERRTNGLTWLAANCRPVRRSTHGITIAAFGALKMGTASASTSRFSRPKPGGSRSGGEGRRRLRRKAPARRSGPFPFNATSQQQRSGISHHWAYRFSIRSLLYPPRRVDLAGDPNSPRFASEPGPG